MTAKVTSTHSNNGITVQFVTHYSLNGDEYTIQIQDAAGNWTRHGGRDNYMRNRDEAQREFFAVSDKLLTPPARPTFEVIAP